MPAEGGSDGGSFRERKNEGGMKRFDSKPKAALAATATG
jgi:hypothetical protein